MLKDKLAVATAILSDTIIGFFMGNSPETTVNTAYAVMTTIRDLKSFFVDTKQINDFILVSDAYKNIKGVKFEKDLRKKGIISNTFEEANPSVIDLATFTKHAKADPCAIEIFFNVHAIECLDFVTRDYMKLVNSFVNSGIATYEPDAFEHYKNDRICPRILCLLEYSTQFQKDYEVMKDHYISSGNIQKLCDDIDNMRDNIFRRILERGLTKPPQMPEIYLNFAWDQKPSAAPEYNN